jgi:hypothetical protein
MAQGAYTVSIYEGDLDFSDSHARLKNRFWQYMNEVAQWSQSPTPAALPATVFPNLRGAIPGRMLESKTFSEFLRNLPRKVTISQFVVGTKPEDIFGDNDDLVRSLQNFIGILDDIVAEGGVISLRPIDRDGTSPLRYLIELHKNDLLAYRGRYFPPAPGRDHGRISLTEFPEAIVANLTARVYPACDEFFECRGEVSSS